LTLDAGLTAALTLVLCAVLLAERSDALHWWLLAWTGMGLAVLSKGPVGIVIPGAALVLQSLWRLDFSLWRRMRWLPGLALLLAITLPWFVAVSWRHPEFLQFFFVHEHLQRYLTPEARREGAWWYFAPILLVGLMPWTSALPWLLRPRRGDFAASLLLCWTAFVFLFFSASDSKLPSYILPMFPALVLLLVPHLERASSRALARHLLLPTAFWVLLLAALPFVARQAGSPDTPASALRPLLVGVAIGAVIFLAAAAAAWALLRRGRRRTALLAVGAGQLLALLVVLQSHDAFGQLKSSAAIARAVAPLIDARTPVYALRDYDQTLPFYLRRPVTLVEVRDEFEFGENLEPGRWIPTLDEFIARWNREPHAAAYLSRATLDELRARGLAMRIVYEDPRRLMVVKP
ncbi:MAG: glycosyltransferase family 39 protein, partial [Burkholderiales bacterium]|nr:glycosyltransferase family 39 protein [Burkholderiales bacterium]